MPEKNLVFKSTFQYQLKWGKSVYGFRARINGLCCLWALRVIFWVLTVACVSAKKNLQAEALYSAWPLYHATVFPPDLTGIKGDPIQCHCLLSRSYRRKWRPLYHATVFCLDLTGIKGDPTPCHCLFSRSYRRKWDTHPPPIMPPPFV